MVTIQGLNGLPEPKAERTSKVRSEREAASTRLGAASTDDSTTRDDVSISSEAKAAAEAGRLFQATKSQEEMRADRIEQAKQRIAEGQYKNREVVSKVAEKLLKLIG